ncbi:tyrosine-type recombinase/integrase [Paraburkholderia sacchari]|uniref:tyrosine-type recombinase/integrase n=1 Tax=Paraburkholderia sacchari TaxID=159450 RepID=UPI0039A75E0B
MIGYKKTLNKFLSENVINGIYSEGRMAQAATLRPAQIRHLLAVTSATSRHPERDCLVLLLGITCGMRVSEIAQIEVQDVLFPSGAIRSEASLRAAITKGCRQRCVYLTHPKTVSALECYLNHRIARGMGTELSPERYRGLSPSSCLILAGKGRKFAMSTKRRINEAGEPVDYSACDSLQSHVTKLYKDAGIRGGSSHSGRRSFASNLVEQGHDIETVQQLLGHAELEHVLPYLAVSDRKLRQMFCDVL